MRLLMLLIQLYYQEVEVNDIYLNREIEVIYND